MKYIRILTFLLTVHVMQNSGMSTHHIISTIQYHAQAAPVSASIATCAGSFVVNQFIALPIVKSIISKEEYSQAHMVLLSAVGLITTRHTEKVISRLDPVQSFPSLYQLRTTFHEKLPTKHPQLRSAIKLMSSILLYNIFTRIPSRIFKHFTKPTDTQFSHANDEENDIPQVTSPKSFWHETLIAFSGHVAVTLNLLAYKESSNNVIYCSQ